MESKRQRVRDQEVIDARADMELAKKWNDGPRTKIVLNTNVQWKWNLTDLQYDYVNQCIRNKNMLRVVETARLMNKYDVTFKHAIKKYFAGELAR